MDRNAASPFKFLDPYGRQDHEIFFGRNKEIESLYQSVNKNRLVLVYGQSGTGKTSLVQCGLTNRFEATDWLPFFIRRGKDLNRSLRQTIGESRALGGAQLPDTEALLNGLERISSRYLRPIYLIFDQFEELLILGDQTEKQAFLNTLQQLIKDPRSQACHLLFILREEYFAWLDEFEQTIPGFSDRRIRVEPMGSSRIKEVILESFKAFDIALEDEERVLNQILANLKSSTGYSLPYLQVYLDRLWRDDYRRTYPNGWNDPGLPPLTFTLKEVIEAGRIEDVLARFLEERKKRIQQSLTQAFPDIPSDYVQQVLDGFATEEGTKRPIPFTLEGEQVVIGEQAPQLLRDLDPTRLTFCLHELEQSRILRSGADAYELAHDSLAALVDAQRSDAQRQRNEARRSLRQAHKDFQNKRGDYLSEKQLSAFEGQVDHLGLEPVIVDFFYDSKRYREQQRNAALEEERKKSRTATRYAVLGFVLAAVAIVTSIFGWTQYVQAEEAREVAESAQLEAVNNLVARDIAEFQETLDRTELILKGGNCPPQQLIAEIDSMEQRYRDHRGLQAQIQQLDLTNCRP